MCKTSLLSSLVLALTIGAAAAGCSDDDPCARLTRSIAKSSGGSADTVESWLKETMTGPDGKALSASESKTSCAMILGDKDALAGYQEAAAAAFKE